MKIITTDYQKQIYWKTEETAAEEIGCNNLIKIYPDYQKQQMKGFGGAFTEAAGFCYEKLPKEKKKEFLQAYFGDEGLRYNIGRTHINSCDFALENYDALSSDGEDLDLTRANQYVLPLMKDARSVCREEPEFLLSPWSPPASMKTNGEMNHGGKLKPECRKEWAQYIARYLCRLKEEGIKISYLTIQNEPEAVQTWDSCVYSAKEEMEFACEYLADALAGAGLSHVRILVWDHNKEIVYDRAKEIFRNEKALETIYGVAVHWYTGDHFQGLSMVKETWPEKEIFFTEGCVEYSRFMDSNEVNKAEMYAHDMIGNFNNGVSAFFDWNLLLDEKGGPNHVGNFCAAPVMASEDGLDFEKRLSYYYIGHFSRYVKKGACAAAVTSFSTDVETSGFVNPSGERVIVLLNRQEKAISIALGKDGKGKNLLLAPHTITTVCYMEEELK
ncbi:MAG: glycoside hydrolase family 30 beta sandwich domain-containing protein [Eubacteriales bacterium]|nr:glycoside hydrolase family 30 beta sandwich domain-containing protein [Eubacteriales bacterium]